MHVRFLALAVSSSLFSGCTEYKFASDPNDGPGAGAGVPIIVVDPLEVDFGSQDADAASETARVVTVGNEGDALLRISDVALVDTSAPFTVTAVEATDLIPGASTLFTVTFIPDDVGTYTGIVAVDSNDPENPTVAVDLLATVLEPEEPEEVPDPDITLIPETHDFGVVDADTTEELVLTISNDGEADLLVTDFEYSATSDELVFERDPATNGPLPWTLAPGDRVYVYVEYTPVDEATDTGTLTVFSDDPDEPEVTAIQTGSGRPFEGFSTGWYIYDDGIPYETTSNPNYVVDHHGDYDLYWYEPSGAHGLIDSSDPETDFETMRDYVIDMAGAPSVVSGPLSFSSSSSLATYEWATFTYILCDFYLDPADDPSSYEISSGTVDDGIQVMVNGNILGRIKLGEAGNSWPLTHAVAGEVNTLIVILVDDSEILKYVYDLAFYKDGTMVE